MSLLKQLLKGVAYNFFAVLATRGIAIFVAIIIARTFNIENFGRYSFLMAIAALLMPLADFGIPISLQKYLSNFDSDKVSLVIGCAFVGRFLISFIISLLLIALDIICGVFHNYGIYIALIIFFSSFNLVVMSLNAELKFKHSAIVQIVIEVFFAVTVIAAIVFSWSIQFILLFRGLSYLVIGLPVLFLYVKPQWTSIVQEFKVFSKIISFGFMSTALVFLSVLFNQAGLVILGFINDYEATGILKVAISLSTLMLIIPEIIRKPLLPIISHAVSVEKNKSGLIDIHRRIQKTVIVILVPIFIFVSVFAKQIIITTFGDGYENAVVPFRILLVVNTLAAITISYFSILYMAGSVKTLIRIGMSSAAICIVGNFFLASDFGPIGSAVAALLAQITGTVWIICAFKNIMLNEIAVE